MDRQLVKYIARGEIAALIPARGGSKGIPHKNIRLLKGHPLIAYSIAAAQLSKRTGRVIVSTDSEQIAEIATYYGAEVPFLRPVEFAQDLSPDIDFVKHAIQYLGGVERWIPEYFVHLRPTTPLRDARVMDQGIEMLLKNEEATALRSGSICEHPPYKWFVEKENHYLEPLMGGSCDEANLPRQSFPRVYIPNGYVDVLKADFIIRYELLYGEKMLGYETAEVPDIDELSAFKKIERYPEYADILNELASELDKKGRKYEKLC